MFKENPNVALNSGQLFLLFPCLPILSVSGCWKVSVGDNNGLLYIFVVYTASGLLTKHWLGHITKKMRPTATLSWQDLLCSVIANKNPRPIFKSDDCYAKENQQSHDWIHFYENISVSTNNLYKHWRLVPFICSFYSAFIKVLLYKQANDPLYYVCNISQFVKV